MPGPVITRSAMRRILPVAGGGRALGPPQKRSGQYEVGPSPDVLLQNVGVRARGGSPRGDVGGGWLRYRVRFPAGARFPPLRSSRNRVGPARVRQGSAWGSVVVALGVMTLLLLVGGVRGTDVPALHLTADSTRPLVPEPLNAVLAATLQPSSTAVREGGTVDLLLNLTMQSCGTPVLLGITFQFGDGFQYAESVSVTPFPSAGPSCHGTVPMAYIYHQAGSFSVNALVTPPSPPNVTSNSVLVNVTPAVTPLTSALDGTVATLGAVVAVVAGTMVVRRYSRPPPGLPPSEV
jgi:hypothetical protein